MVVAKMVAPRGMVNFMLARGDCCLFGWVGLVE